MSNQQAKISAKYAAADRIRKQREAEKAATEKLELVETARAASQRQRVAEGRYQDIMRHAKVLPNELTEQVVSRMLHEMVTSRVAREAVEPVVDALMERLIIRIDRRAGPMGVEVEIDNDRPSMDGKEPTISVHIPKLHLTFLMNDPYVDSVLGGRGPVVMEDRPIHMAIERSGGRYVADATAPVETVLI